MHQAYDQNLQLQLGKCSLVTCSLYPADTVLCEVFQVPAMEMDVAVKIQAAAIYLHYTVTNAALYN